MSDTVLSGGTTSSILFSKPSKDSAIGVSFSHDEDGVKVSKVKEGGLAEQAGLKVGDTVQTINGNKVSKSYTAAKMIRDSKTIDITTTSFDEISDVENKKVSLITEDSKVYPDEASLKTFSLGFTIAVVQVVAAYNIFAHFDYGDVEEFTTEKYIIFRDIMVMLLLGFGYLMTFLEKYGLGAVGFTMLLTVLNMECNLMIEGLLTSSLNISLDSIINAEFSAAALLISFGALIGRATPHQMCLIAISESIFYAINKVIIVFGILNAEDVGGTLTIHMFGAFFGLAAAYALGPQEKASASNNSASRVSDVFSLVGTTLLWVYWPSFVGATETGDAGNEMHCLINTIMALIGSTGTTFYLSQHLNEGKFDAVHIQNSTLAGGVAIGATARLAIGSGLSLLVGMGAGTVSVFGYFYSSPFLEEKFGIFDTCGVANLHGYPSVLGGLASILLVFVDYKADFLMYGLVTQSIIQLLAVVATLAMAIVSGFVTGSVVLKNPTYFADIPDYEDAIWWTDVE